MTNNAVAVKVIRQVENDCFFFSMGKSLLIHVGVAMLSRVFHFTYDFIKFSTKHFPRTHTLHCNHISSHITATLHYTAELEHFRNAIECGLRVKYVWCLYEETKQQQQQKINGKKNARSQNEMDEICMEPGFSNPSFYLNKRNEPFVIHQRFPIDFVRLLNVNFSQTKEMRFSIFAKRFSCH